MEKKRNDLTELVFILDRSGSMAGLESDTIGGFNGLIDKQKKVDGKAFVTTVLFDNQQKTVHDRIDLAEVAPMTEKEYYVGGSTALLDAVGDTVTHIEQIHKYVRPEDVPAHTMVVITTDGMENSSHRWRAADVKKLVEKKKEGGWEFLFLGANIDAVSEAARFGIDA
ncbi:MAG: VWA domain-containing protein, partial [Clostridia bacterium]|nr:VWA domain-containing protein [Clostridia bacterium]